MRIATCTPVDFPADAHFFGRDCGLLCRGFHACGVDAWVVMPGCAHEGDEGGVIRCSPVDLEDAAWWRARALDLVVLYAWGDPRYLAVAVAIRRAGIKLVQSLDTAGLASPYSDLRAWWRCLWGMFVAPVPLWSRIRLMIRAVRDLVPSVYERRRLKMLEQSEAIAAVSEPAAKSIDAYLRAFDRKDIAEKLVVLPHAVAGGMCLPPGAHRKRKNVLVVGRWLAEDRAQKDPELVIAVLGKFLRSMPDWSAEVVGRGSTALARMTAGWGDELRSRLVLTEKVPREELVAKYQQSSILLCASRWESFHISSAEAVCCGCSIVVAEHPLLASTAWFATMQSGTVAPRRSMRSLADALCTEAVVWQTGGRNPSEIADAWGARLHARRVAESVMRLMDVHES